MWWTVFVDPERPTPFRAATDGIYQGYLPEERRLPENIPGPLRVESWTTELRRGDSFGPVNVDFIRWTHQLTPDGARLLRGSFPNVYELDPATRRAFLDEIAEAVLDHGGSVEDPYVTAIYRTRPLR